MATKKDTKNSKPDNEAKKAAAKAKAKAKKPDQLKIEGTGRTDAIDEIEAAAARYREARDARMEMAEEEAEAQEDLTNALRKHNVNVYKYEGGDGKLYEAYLPGEVKAKVRRVKEPKAPRAEAHAE